jgi:hypothetical protein
MYEVVVSEHYHQNQERSRCRHAFCAPCAVCGKSVDQSKAHWTVHLHYGGQIAVTEDEADALNASEWANAEMGFHPVGPECAKNADLRPYLHRHQGMR